MNPELEKRIAAVAADRQSGASGILSVVLAILRDALAAGEDVAAVAAALRRAQPAMAPVWNAASAAEAGTLERFASRVERAPRAIARFAADVFLTGVAPGAPLRVVTLSFSGTVAYALESMAPRCRLEVRCSESRPGLEGRRLASRLAAAGLRVTCFADAALGHALAGADLVVVGADAVAAEWFVNKCGTLMLAAAASRQGVPVYVLAGRDKFASPGLSAQLELTGGPPDEVWSAPPAGVSIPNPYFERIPVEVVTAVVSDIGVLLPSDLTTGRI